LQRSRILLSHGRSIWRDLLAVEGPLTPGDMTQYLKSLYHAVNAVAELSGPPLQERRLMLEFPPRAETAQRPSLNDGLMDLLGTLNLDPSVIQAWVPEWKGSFEAAMENSRVDPRIHPARLNYYEKAIRAMLEGEKPQAALWPLLQTWTLAVDALPEQNLSAWRSACDQLGFTAADIEARVNGLDQYLDEVEVLLDELATQYGLETSTSI